MATIRILATVCAALCVGLMLTLGFAELTPAAAQTAAEAPLPAQTRPGRPLNLLPHLGNTRKFTRTTRSPTRVAKTRTAHRVAQRRAPARAFARRRNVPEVASREDNDSVTPNRESLGYQADGAEAKTQPPIDAWLRSPLPPAPPRAAARMPATPAAVSPVASPAPAAASSEAGPAAETIAVDTIPANAAVPDTTPADLSANNSVQVADASQINEIDLAADATTTPAPADKSWLNSMLAILGGAFAAAATAGFLFGRRRQPKFRRSYS